MMLLAMASAWAGSAGLIGGPLAFRGPARHDLRAGVGAWVRGPLGSLEIQGELLGAARARSSIEYRTTLVRGAATLGAGTGNERVHVGVGAGPAFVLREGRVGSYGFFTVDPAVRALTHFEVGLGASPLTVRYQLGTAVRGAFAWDFDTFLGVGARW